jgi:hypothetical protein
MKDSDSKELPSSMALTVRVAQPHEVAAFDVQLADRHPDQPLPELLEHLHSRPGRCLNLLNS